MPSAPYLLLGPEGKSARVQLPDDRPLTKLHSLITRPLGLSSAWELVLRSESGSRLDQYGTLATAGVPRGGRILVEQTMTPWTGGFLGRVRKPANEVILRPYRVMPCYLVIDTSASMRGPAIKQINDEVPNLRYSMAANPELAEVCQLAIVTFDKSAQVHTTLTDITKMEYAPLDPDGVETNYRAAFELLRDVIAKDLYRLYLEGWRPYVPVVFFLSDGRHNAQGDWSDAIVRLTDPTAFHGAPHMIAFGFGDASEASIKDVGRTRAYMPTDRTALADLQSFMSFLLQSLTMSMSQVAAFDDNDPFSAPLDAPSGWRPM